MRRRIIDTDQAPRAIGTYSQAVQVGGTLYLSGQIPLVPETMELVAGDIQAQLRRVFDNLAAVAAATGGRLTDVVKLTVFLTNLENFPIVNQVMAEYFTEPYPARAVVGVDALPKGAAVEIEAILTLPNFHIILRRERPVCRCAGHSERHTGRSLSNSVAPGSASTRSSRVTAILVGAVRHRASKNCPGPGVHHTIGRYRSIPRRRPWISRLLKAEMAP